MAIRERPTTAASTTASALSPSPPAAQVERRRRIITAALELLEQSDLEAVQMRDVADRAGVALATVYRYFTSKDHLYAAAIVEWSAAFYQRVEVQRGEAGATDEMRLRIKLRRTFRALERSPQFIRALMILESSSDERAQKELDVFNAEYLAAMERCLHDLSPETARAVLMVVLGVYNTEVRWWAQERATIRDVQRHLEQTLDLIFGELPTTVGRSGVHDA